MRIVVLQAVAAKDNSVDNKRAADLMRRNMNLVKQRDTELTFRIPRRGITGLESFFYTYIHHLNDEEAFHAAVQAEMDGFDAVIMGCYFDPILRDVRQAVNIPVVGPAESSMLLATMMGAKFGIVTISAEAVYDYEENIAKYGLQERAVRPRPIPETAEEQETAFTDAHHEIAAFIQVARELIADGADVLIPGCTAITTALRLAPGAEKEYPNGLTEVDGVPVMDVLGATVKMAETLVAFKQAGSSWISRKGLYAQATPKAIELGQMLLKYDGPGFWDY